MSNMPKEMLDILKAMGINPDSVKVIKLDLDDDDKSVEEDKNFLDEYVKGNPLFGETPEGYRLSDEAIAAGFPAGCGNPDCDACYAPIATEQDREEAEEEEQKTPESIAPSDTFEMTQEMLERLVNGQLALMAAAESTYGILKEFLEPEELAIAEESILLATAAIRGTEKKRSEVIGQAKGFAFARYGLAWDDVPYEVQREMIEFFEERKL